MILVHDMTEIIPESQILSGLPKGFIPNTGMYISRLRFGKVVTFKSK